MSQHAVRIQPFIHYTAVNNVPLNITIHIDNNSRRGIYSFSQLNDTSEQL